MPMHHGKLDYALDTSVTEAMGAWIVLKAHQLGVSKSDLLRDLLWLGATGRTFSACVSQDKQDALKAVLEEFREMAA